MKASFILTALLAGFAAAAAAAKPKTVTKTITKHSTATATATATKTKTVSKTGTTTITATETNTVTSAGPTITVTSTSVSSGTTITVTSAGPTTTVSATVTSSATATVTSSVTATITNSVTSTVTTTVTGTTTSPTAAPTGKQYLYVFPGDGTTRKGCLITAGTWYNGGGTCATYTSTPAAAMDGTFTLKTSKGDCAVGADDSTLTCGTAVTAPSFFGQTADGNLTYAGSPSFYAAANATGTTQQAVFATPGAVPLAITIFSLT